MFRKIPTYLTLASTLLVGAMFFFRFAAIIGPEGDVEKIMYYEKIPYLVMLIMLISGCFTIIASTFVIFIVFFLSVFSIYSFLPIVFLLLCGKTTFFV